MAETEFDEFTLRLDPEQNRALDEYAEERGLSKSDVVRRAIQRLLTPPEGPNG